MSAVAAVENGKIVESTSASSIASSSSTSNSTLDKDAFLQLLVAQMKYQDPLEPTSNTEYISQYATFSELEQMQNMSATLELSRASTLVGKNVLLNVTSSTGYTTMIQGNVDYVVYENNKAYLSVNGELYSLDDLDTVVDDKYLEAYTLAATLLNIYNKLPDVDKLTLDEQEDVEEMQAIYESMTSYQLGFLTSDEIDDIEAYIAKMEQLTAAEESSADAEENDSTEGTGSTGEE